MDKKEKQQTFGVKYMDSENVINKSIIKCWFEIKENPEIYDLVHDKYYNFKGKFRIYFLEFIDEKGNIFSNKSDRLSNAFYGLCKKLEIEGIKLLIKGCNIDYWMIPRLQYSIKSIKLTLGKRTTIDDPVVMIFESEDNLNNIATVDKQLEYHNKWLESVKDLPY